MRLADRWFRMMGGVTLALLAATLALQVAGREAWRPVFGLAHLAALVALVPLGIAILRHATREASAAGAGPLLPALVQRHPQVAFLLAAAALTIVLSLLNFEDGNRALRRVANLTTVAIMMALVLRYLRWPERPALTRSGPPPAAAPPPAVESRTE